MILISRCDMANLSDFLKSINTTKENVFDRAKTPNEYDDIENAYTPFVVNRCLSYFPDTILLVEELNRRPKIPKYYQYKFLLTLVRKRGRFKKWDKIEREDDINIVKEYFGYSLDKAIQALKVLTESDLSCIKSILESRKGLVKK